MSYNTLFLKGIDYEKVGNIDDKFDEGIISSIKLSTIEEEEEVVEFGKLPKVFTNFESWPKKINLNCWSCHSSIKSVPVFIPNIENKKEIEVYGCFCSFNCAQLYVNLHYERLKIIHYSSNLHYLFKIFYGKKINMITPSYNPLEKLDRFGGKWTQVEFNRKQKELKAELTLIP